MKIKIKIKNKKKERKEKNVIWDIFVLAPPSCDSMNNKGVKKSKMDRRKKWKIYREIKLFIVSLLPIISDNLVKTSFKIQYFVYFVLMIKKV